MIKLPCTYTWSRLMPTVSRNDENRIQTRFMRQAFRKSLRGKRKFGVIREHRKTNNSTHHGAVAKTLNAINLIVKGKAANVDKKDNPDRSTSEKKENTNATSSLKVEPPSAVQTRKSVDNEPSAKSKKSSSVLLFKKNSFYNPCALVNPSFPARDRPTKSRIEKYFEELEREQNKNSKRKLEKPDDDKRDNKLNTSRLEGKEEEDKIENLKSDLPVTNDKLLPEKVLNNELPENFFNDERVKTILRQKERLEQELRLAKGQSLTLEQQKELLRPTSQLYDIPFKSETYKQEPVISSPENTKYNLYQQRSEIASQQNYKAAVPSNINKQQAEIQPEKAIVQSTTVVKAPVTSYVNKLQGETQPECTKSPLTSNIDKQQANTKPEYAYNQYSSTNSAPVASGLHEQQAAMPLQQTVQSQYAIQQNTTSEPSLTSHAFASRFEGTRSDSQLTTKKKEGIFKTLKNKLFFWRRKPKEQTTGADGLTHSSVQSTNQTSPQPNYSQSNDAYQSQPHSNISHANDYQQIRQPSQTSTNQDYSIPTLTQNVSLPSLRHQDIPTNRSLVAKYSDAVRDFTGRTTTAEPEAYIGSSSPPAVLFPTAKSSAPQPEPKTLVFQSVPQNDAFKYSPQSTGPQPLPQNLPFKPLSLRVPTQPLPNVVEFESLPTNVTNQSPPQSFAFQSQPQMVQSSIILPHSQPRKATNYEQTNVFQNPLAFSMQPQSYQAAVTNSVYQYPYPNQVAATSSMYQFPTIPVNSRQTFMPQQTLMTPMQHYPYLATVMTPLKHPWYQGGVMTPMNQYINKAVVMTPMNLQRYITAAPTSKQPQLPQAYQAGFVSPLCQCANKAVVTTSNQPYIYQAPLTTITGNPYVY